MRSAFVDAPGHQGLEKLDVTDSAAERLDKSTAMVPVSGFVDIDVPVDLLWDAFTQADGWPRWNACMFWVANHDLVPGQRLVWAFEPIKWWYLYKLPAVATLVEVEPRHHVTWEITAVPGFYARHTYFMEDLGNGRSRFGSYEKAMGPTLDAMMPFWIAHFTFVKDASLDGARSLESVYQLHGAIDPRTLPRRSLGPTLVAAAAAFMVAIGIRRLIRRFRR